MQTIRSVQWSVDGGVDSNILQRNISIIEAVQIQLVRIETLFSDHESRVPRGFHPCLGLFTWRGGLERHAQIQGNMY